MDPKNVTTEITTEMKRAYLDYAMSVIVSRALPDVKDGLKPVHRRVLYAMHKMGLSSGARFSKSAKVVGEVLGKYHPHGDSSVYEAMARMAQDFTMRYPLVKGQGNFGSVDGDPPAAMRYTEVKLAKIADELLFDIDKETVSWTDNFDATLKEPLYLPGKLPNLLLMGAEGIAVGMATKIPPHNLNELIDAICFMIDKAKIDTNNNDKSNKDTDKQTPSIKKRLIFNVTIDELFEYIKGPDFPTEGIIYGAADIKQAYVTGKGKVLIRAKIEEEDMGKGKMAMIVRQLPYQVNKANLVEKIARLVTDKKIVGISDLRDESDRDGIRVVIELKRDASYKKVLNNLFKFTELQTSFPVNMVALVDGIPQTLSLKTILELYLKHRVNMVTRRSEFELREAKKRAHILEGYLIALDHIDEVIAVIKKSKDETEAKLKLMKKFGLSEAQTLAILEMQLRRLTGLERSKIQDELKMLRETIAYLESLLKDIFKVLKVIKDELLYLKEKYGDERKTKVIKSRPGEITDEQLIENKEVIVVLTKEGYIKQVPRETFRVQNRGGKGVSGIETKETDNVYHITTAMTHDFILFFTNQGRIFQNRVWDIPQGSRISKGKAIINLLTLRPEEKVTSLLTYQSPSDAPQAAIIQGKTTAITKSFIFMVTKHGTVKKTQFQDFANIRNNGIIAIKLEPTDELLWVKITDGNMNILLTTKHGKAIIFKEGEVRPTGRASIGVKGIELEKEDEITSADVFANSEFKKNIFVIGKKGVGKKTNLSLFKGQHRGGKGVKVASVDEKIGQIVFVQIINPEDTTVIITSMQGQVVKIPLGSIPPRSRSAKGVILMRFSQKGDEVVSATLV
ncbi:DNA gyrase subunit A [Candidatus Roizmanbacteria bacterium RIFOXYB2_FULL_38_10]|uniref:DNA gyrase subunit A n=1 Tax=Candidatus Roizmanbacteria bacterium RIFOXYD1_FULL_38_12 TaxID=1802093 RepID=A0A1F7L2F0_9BACT|nr:MAG: DNA gyrase subunit A [Candidatus Roizmanbacteria bacterium RIFOXYA2_FULL_38_14]OGK64339.1 MAG: DNA gyrase subunit A [Candidatus Roizmanbacteria bacterium RIFOXYA1_FULL_37_12]OGK66185.1 MAG: DNA gyrase subunit A [Candidatus Roizmanbacteria bacterium RIFOXYB1_FULL_40_23]OGK68384.1 MAG: DNA gyrase subunit A [Candidatus Roizmanbacteria bacterium RIFOXYB2_FULL_38_10]OGK70590.1 MAG: DNA gyrase subunit A [Candidatus Roizmanbacteria bacterium RIFOXYC1_FULL_38_14]OGK73080.1 MAG: DNA gyrase subu